MMNCNTCGREIATGTICPFCGAHNPVAPGNTTPGVLVSRRGVGTEISATHVIVGINVAVFLAMALSGASLLSPTREQLLRWGANWGPLSLGAQPWRMLTSNYVHIGIVHILFNMWCLWNLGRLAERVLGRLNYVVLYTFCGLAGSLASLWWHPLSVGAGASGAIFGLAGAAIAVFYLGHLPIAKEAISGTMRSLLTFVGYNLFFGLTPGIDNSAHIGGLVAGLAMGAALSKHIMVAPEVRRQWARVTWIAMAVRPLCGVWGNSSPISPACSVRQSPGHGGATTGERQTRLTVSAERTTPFRSCRRSSCSVPETPSPNICSGEAYLYQHKPDQAIAAFQEALRLRPDYAEAEAAMGSAYLDKGMKPEAEAGVQEGGGTGLHREIRRIRKDSKP